MQPASSANGLSLKQAVGLIIVQCTIQGGLVPLLTTFLSSKTDRNMWFKIYVICVNILTLAQTILHVVQSFDALSSALPYVAMIPIDPVLTASTSALVQAFFIHRCWQIFQQRILPIIPFLLLSLCGLISGILMSVFLSQPPDQDSIKHAITAMGVWTFGSLVLDACTTFTTIIYLFRSRTGMRRHKNIFNTVWQVMWASAAPPLILMIFIVIVGFILPHKSCAATAFLSSISGKFFVLSLMFTLLGQGYIRQQFESSRFPESTNRNTFRNATHSQPVFIGMTLSTIDNAHEASSTVAQGGPDQESPKNGCTNDSNTGFVSIVEYSGCELTRPVHKIELPSA